jgi:hypothetical protein
MGYGEREDGNRDGLFNVFNVVSAFLRFGLGDGSIFE